MYGIGLNPVYQQRMAARDAKREASGAAAEARDSAARETLIDEIFAVPQTYTELPPTPLAPPVPSAAAEAAAVAAAAEAEAAEAAEAAAAAAAAAAAVAAEADAEAEAAAVEDEVAEPARAAEKCIVESEGPTEVSRRRCG